MLPPLVEPRYPAAMLAAALLPVLMSAPPAAPIPVLVGTYTGGGSRGIYRLTVDPKTGELGEPTLVGEVDNPSFLAVNPAGTHVYAVSEAFGGGRADGVTAFRLEPDGSLAKLNAQPTAPDGAKAGACHVAVTPDGRVVLAANYGGGSAASFPVKDDGSLGEPASFVAHEGSGPIPKRQEAPHAHAFTPAPGGRFAIVPDLGADRLFVYRVDPATAELTEHSTLATPPGGGPRHLAFTPDGTHAVACLEMGNKALLLDWDAGAGRFTIRQAYSTLPADFDGQSTTAEVRVHPNGRFAYVTNRGHDSVAVFRLGPDDGGGAGGLSLVEIEPATVQTPRGMNLTPDGRFLLVAGQDSNDVTSFRVNPDTGALTPTGSRIRVSKPVDLLPLAP